MKPRSASTLIALGIVALLAFTVQSQAQRVPDRMKVAVLEDGAVVPTLSQDELEMLFASHFDLEGNGQGPELETVTFLDGSYLMARGHDADGNCTSVARGLELVDGTLFLAEETHTCAGVGCTSCAYKRDPEPDGKIVGCNCLEPVGVGAYCNHTVSGGT